MANRRFNFDDNIEGTDRDDFIFSGRGNDTIRSGNGDDFIFSGRGNNTVDAGAGDDVTVAGRGDDAVDAGAGDDVALAGRGDDTVSGGDGEDKLFGQRGDDTLVGNKGDDRVFGQRGDDTLVWNNGDGSDLFNGGRGDDRAQVNFNTDLVNDDLQNDDVVEISDQKRGVQLERVELNGQTDAGLFAIDIRQTETLETNLGGGNDTLRVEEAAANNIIVEADGGGDDTDSREANDAGDIAQGDTADFSQFESGVRVDLDENNQGVLQAENDLSNDTAQGLSEFGNVQVDGEVIIDELNDFENAIGTSSDDVLLGNGQDNVLIGGEGDDALHPFGGTDFVDGGAGTDTLLLNGFGQGSTVDLAAGVADNPSGVNTIANIENVNGSSVAGDVIIGDDNDNVLDGLGGNDELIGGAGNDTLIGGDNVDRARADAQGDNSDILRGGAGNDTLIGGAGNDTLEGGSGSDTFVFDDNIGQDVITDFDANDDTEVIDLSQNSVLNGFNDLDIEQQGDDVVIGPDSITLENVNAGDLDADDFLF